MISGQWITWANLVTATRLALLPGFTFAILFNDWLVASVLFILAVLSDILDGRLARRYGQTSPLGGLFDHATDAIFVTLSCWALADLGLINIYLWWLIPLAFLQYMADSKALAGSQLRTSVLGKANGIAYFALVGTAVGIHVLGWHFLTSAVQIMAWGLVLSTGVSMLDRLWTLLRKVQRS